MEKKGDIKYNCLECNFFSRNRELKNRKKTHKIIIVATRA